MPHGTRVLVLALLHGLPSEAENRGRSLEVGKPLGQIDGVVLLGEQRHLTEDRGAEGLEFFGDHDQIIRITDRVSRCTVAVVPIHQPFEDQVAVSGRQVAMGKQPIESGNPNPRDLLQPRWSPRHRCESPVPKRALEWQLGEGRSKLGHRQFA